MLGFIREFDNKGVYRSFPKHYKREEITLFQNLKGDLLIYIYIYIEREREREREREIKVKILLCFVPKMKKLSLFCYNKKANIILCISLLI